MTRSSATRAGAFLLFLTLGVGVYQYSQVTVSGAFLSFANSTGAGMGVVCAGTTPTGSNGQALTFTRTGGASCLKSASQLVGIQPGDMVTVTDGQPRVVVGALGYRGLLRENAGTNTAHFSEAFSNAAWAATGVGVAAPTVTADQRQSPDGGLQMDRISAPATAANQQSTVLQRFAGTTSATGALSVFVQGWIDAGTTDLCIQTAAGAWSCAPCAYPQSDAGISRCALENVAVTTGADAGTIFIGNATELNGGTIRSAVDLVVWGAQYDTDNGTITSYMPAVSSSDGTRGQEIADFPAALSGLSALSMSAWFVPNSRVYKAGSTTVSIVLGDGTIGSTSAPSTYVWLYSADSSGQAAVDTAGVASAGFNTWGPFFADFDGGAIQTAAFETGQFLGICAEGVCAAAAGNPGISSTLGTPVFTRLMLGRAGSTSVAGLNGIISNVCLDKTPSRCLPPKATGPAVWIGDSIIYGTGSIPQTPYVQLSRQAGKTITGAGVGSNTIDLCTSRWESLYKGGGYSTLIWSCAVNSAAAGQTGATMATNVEVVLAEAHALGMKVIVTGIMPWANSSGWTLGENTEGLAYNSALSTYCGVGANGCTYVSTDSMGTGSPLALTVANDSGDHIHPTVVGAGALATLVNAASP